MSTEHTPEELNALYLETGRAYAKIAPLMPMAREYERVESSPDGIEWGPFLKRLKTTIFLRLAPTPEDRAKAEQIANNESVRKEWEAGGRKRAVDYRNPRCPEGQWMDCRNKPNFMDEFIYRLRPEPVYVPYSFADDLRGKMIESKDGEFRGIIHGQNSHWVSAGSIMVTYADLFNRFTETENGIQRPCGKREEAK